MGFAEKLIKKFKDEDVISFSDKDLFKDQSVWVPTGTMSLEKNLGVLGFPVGISLVAGPSRSGKTSLCLHVMEKFQKQYLDGLCVILSSEARDNKLYAKKIGVNTDDVIIIKSKFLEDLMYKFQVHINEFKKMWTEAKMEGKPKIFCMFDSLGGCLSRAEKNAYDESVEIMTKNMEDGKDRDANVNPKMMAFQKEAKRLFKGLMSQLYDIDLIFIAIAHTGDSPDGRGKVVYGGSWQEFFSTIRLQTTIVGHEKLDDEEVAQYTKVKVLKNDFGSRKETILELLLGYGFVLSEEDINYGIEKGLIVKESAKKHTAMNGKLKWSTKREFYQIYKDGNPLMKVLHKKIEQEMHRDVLKEKGLSSKVPKKELKENEDK